MKCALGFLFLLYAQFGTGIGGNGQPGYSHNCGAYAYCESITVNHTKMGSTDETGFPVYVAGSTNTQTVANGGHATSASGYDVVYFSGAGCTGTKLAWETELYSASSTGSAYWVLPTVTISHTADTLIGYRCVGNAAITTDQSNPTGTWPSAYKGVWHLPNGSSLSVADSTSNGNNGTNNNSVTAVAGQVDGAAGFNGTNQYVDLGSSSTINISGAITYELWVKFTGTLGSFYIPMSAGGGGPEIILHDGSGPANKFYFQGSSGTTNYTGSIPTVGTWYFLVGTFDGTTLALYQNGVSAGSGAGTITGNVANPNIGRRSASTFYWPGSIDEVRIENVGRSADWALAEYNNQSSPSTFYTLTPQ